MSALVKKEIRLLLPSFSIVVALAFANCFLVADKWGFNKVGFVSFVLWPAVAVFMALTSFGAEISSGTFSMLLAQPIPRGRILRTKALLLAAALAIGGLVWSVLLFWHRPPTQFLGEFINLRSFLLLEIWLFLLVIFSGALWTVLLFRQVAAAFWFTVLVPGFIVVTLAGVLQEKHPAQFGHLTVAALVFYSVAGFLFARSLFLRTQDVQWTGGTIAWPEIKGRANFLSGTAERRWWRPKAALLWKELQLHQSQFVIAGVLVLLHLAVIAVRKFGNISRNSATGFVLDSFWLLWLVMPMLVGAAAVAEERKLGTLTGQLCLPVKRWTQFALKLRVVLLLSVLFGVVMPWVLDGSGLPKASLNLFGAVSLPALKRFGVWPHPLSGWDIFLWHGYNGLDAHLGLLLVLGIAVGIGVISFFASSLTRNTLQAVAPTILGIIVFGLPNFVSRGSESPFGFPLWRGRLIDFIGIPVFLITLLALAFWNFQRINLARSVWRRNILVILATFVLVITATTAIYHRVWGKLTPFEGPHGPAQFSLSNPPVLREQQNTGWVSVRRPDGSIWAGNYFLNTASPNPLELVLGDITLHQSRDGLLFSGSKWADMTFSYFRRAGIKTDGTLWISESLRTNGGPSVLAARTGQQDFVQFGTETNWTSLAWRNAGMLLVKQDGTLWSWGPPPDFWKSKTNVLPSLEFFTPRRLGTGTNWAKVFQDGFEPLLRTRDGKVWKEYPSWQKEVNQKEKWEIEPGFVLYSLDLPKHEKWQTTTMTGGFLAPEYHLAVGEDGSLDLWEMLTQTHWSQPTQFSWTNSQGGHETNWVRGMDGYNVIAVATNSKVGNETNWVSVAGRGGKIVTLKNDGTLWVWNFQPDYNYRTLNLEREILEQKPVRLGGHSDWVAIASASGGIFSLAADGTLWYWLLDSASSITRIAMGNFDFRGSRELLEPLLDVPRKPQLVGRILTF